MLRRIKPERLAMRNARLPRKSSPKLRRNTLNWSKDTILSRLSKKKEPNNWLNLLLEISEMENPWEKLSLLMELQDKNTIHTHRMVKDSPSEIMVMENLWERRSP